jgi:hypothetical protein
VQCTFVQYTYRRIRRAMYVRAANANTRTIQYWEILFFQNIETEFCVTYRSTINDQRSTILSSHLHHTIMKFLHASVGLSFAMSAYSYKGMSRHIEKILSQQSDPFVCLFLEKKSVPDLCYIFGF